MKKRLLLLILILLFTGCSNQKLIDENKIIKSYDESFEITVPSNWNVVDNKGDLNDVANIELSNKRNQKYLIAITESKEDLDMSFEEYQETIFTQHESNYDVKLTNKQDTEINGNKAKYVEFKTKFKSTNVYMRIYTIESQNYYSQILIWTTYSQKELVQKEFNKIIDSYKETK